ncbi:hypothetical protein SLEP1_g17456 [Rubroshorea leprosula]|uniref:WD repeat-containing protein 74 n=2 Tax=Rubroshorea leprosula TaxID=152421 RepID=A0AAV5J3E1_9ROSI|nr:hypothetical protein SLEP1_g17456 [Rubroshorea leprosula]
MPRTTALECPGCPPLRALTFDALGLIKVIEARGKEGGVPKVVEKWGDPDASKSLLAASIDDRKTEPLLAVARKSGAVEILNPVSGELCCAVTNGGDANVRPDDDAIVGLHLFRKNRMDSASRSCILFTCTTKGNASVRSFEITNSPTDSGSSKTWKVSASGNILCSQVDGSENYSLFGGKNVEVNMWDLKEGTKIWTAKPPPKNSLGIFTPTCFTSVAFLSKDDHRKFVAGTNNHQVRLYDISAQRRPVISFDFRETPIKAVTEDLDGHTVYIGNGCGDLASVDIRTGKLLGCFLGKCSGSIRSIARHPEHPVIASCGLDSYLRIWDIKTRQLLSAVFLKQHLTKVVFDTNFTEEEIVHPVTNSQVRESEIGIEMQTLDDEEKPPVKRKKSSKEKESKNKVVNKDGGTKKSKSRKRSKGVEAEIADDE